LISFLHIITFLHYLLTWPERSSELLSSLCWSSVIRHPSDVCKLQLSPWKPMGEKESILAVMVLEKMRFRFVQMKSILPGEWLFMGTKRSKLSKSWKIFSRMSSKNVAIYICWNVRTFLSSDTVFSYFHYKNDFTVTFTFDEGYFYTLYVVLAQTCMLSVPKLLCRLGPNLYVVLAQTCMSSWPKLVFVVWTSLILYQFHLW
jgi:hypothetical protein